MPNLFFISDILCIFAAEIQIYSNMDTKNLTDAIIAGKHRAELMLITAKTVVERTATTIAVAKAVAIEKDFPMAIFSLELSNTRLLAHLLANSAQSNVIELLEAKHANGQLQKSIDALKEKPLFIDDTLSLSSDELREKASLLVNEHNVRVILIDYLELMDSVESEDLKELARELNIPIIALSK